MAHRSLPLVVALLIVAVDRWSKVAIDHSMTAFDSVSLIPGRLRIIHTENAGAAFGILAEGNRWLRGSILIGVSALVLAFVISALWGTRSSFTSGWSRAALSLILGGALGNMYDRLVRGTVTDFLEFYHGSWSFPAFNVADSAISVGAVLLLLELLRPKRKQVTLAHN